MTEETPHIEDSRWVNSIWNATLQAFESEHKFEGEDPVDDDGTIASHPDDLEEYEPIPETRGKVRLRGRNRHVEPTVPQRHYERRDDGSWMKHGNCKDSDIGFFSRWPWETEAALTLCQGCEVLVTCRLWAIETNQVHYGVLGGMTPMARKRLKREMEDGDEPETRSA